MCNLSSSPTKVGGGGVTSKQIEIFVVLAGGHVALPAPVGGKARELGLFDVRVIVDEGGAETFPENLARAQRGDGFAQIFRQWWRLGLIRRVRRGPWAGPAGGRLRWNDKFLYDDHQSTES